MKTCLVLLCFSILSCSVTFRKANGVINSFILLLELGIQCHSTPFPFSLKVLFLLNLLPMYVSLSIFVSPGNSHDLETFFPHWVIEMIFLIIRELWKWQPWCGPLSWLTRTDSLLSLSCLADVFFILLLNLFMLGLDNINVFVLITLHCLYIFHIECVNWNNVFTFINL